MIKLENAGPQDPSAPTQQSIIQSFNHTFSKVKIRSIEVVIVHRLVLSLGRDQRVVASVRGIPGCGVSGWREAFGRRGNRG